MIFLCRCLKSEVANEHRVLSTLDNKSKTLLERDPANPNADSSSTGVVEQPRSTIFRAVRPRPLAVRLLKRPSQPKRSGLQRKIKPLGGQSQPSHPFQRQKPGRRVRLLTGRLQLVNYYRNGSHGCPSINFIIRPYATGDQTSKARAGSACDC